MKAVVILLDSLNRHFLSIHGNTWVQTPNIDRLARQSVVFDNHWLGSAPCMPARRDLMTGRLNFLERPWGGLEPYDEVLQERLNQAGVHTHMETDHYHYWYGGGEFYESMFQTWRSHRGQEKDRCAGPVAPLAEPEHLGRFDPWYERNRQAFSDDSTYPTPRTFGGAVDWLRTNRTADNYLLWVEAFDPHEPFDAPREYLDLYHDDWKGPRYDWSAYDYVDEHSEATRHLQRQYAATLTMADRWLGKLLDELESSGQLEETLIIFTTDHGHFVGERGRTGKNRWHCWNELAHIPLIVHLGGSRLAGQRRHCLTQNIDVMPTLLEYFGLAPQRLTHGRSLWRALDDPSWSPRAAALYGWFGRTVNVTDGRYTYLRAPAGPDNQPLNQYILMPTRFHGRLPAADLKGAQFGTFLPHTDCPVIKAPCNAPIPAGDESLQTMLYDIRDDYGQMRNLAGGPQEPAMVELLRQVLRMHDSPPEQLERLGLKG